jgi:hypothetical protein
MDTYDSEYTITQSLGKYRWEIVKWDTHHGRPSAKYYAEHIAKSNDFRCSCFMRRGQDWCKHLDLLTDFLEKSA